MYVHIGGEYTISDKFIVGIFDFDGTTGPDSETIQFLRMAEKAGQVDIVSPDLPRSFIVTLDRVYYSPISPATLRRRLDRSISINRIAAGKDETGGEQPEPKSSEHNRKVNAKI